jgi:nucleolin
MTLADLEATFKAAKKVYFADKTDKANKKAFKKAKKAFTEAKEAQGAESGKKRAAEESSESPKKKKKKKKHDKDVVDIASLKATLKAAKALWREDKSHEANKKAMRSAKKALAAAQEAENGASAEAAEPAEPAKEVAEKVEDTNLLAGLKSNKKKYDQKKSFDDDETPPNTKVFLGNLSFDIDEATCRKFFEDCGEITDLFWLTDKETEQFRGMGFATFGTLEESAKACEKNGQDLMGRAVRINYAKPRPGGDRRKSGGGAGRGPKPISEKPAGCTTIFVGNLSYDIDDSKITEFFKDCGAISQIRWLKDRDTQEFKGAGFIEFEDPDSSLDKAVGLNGSDLLGRSIRCDYAAPRKPREY